MDRGQLFGVAGILITWFALGALAANAAFGISPPFMNADKLVAGAKYSQTIYLVQSDAEVDLPIKATLDVPERIRSWFVIDKGFDFVIPKGTRQFPVEVTVNIPKTEKLGSYNGSLSFTTAPTAEGQVTIALGAKVIINLIIGTDVYRKFAVPVVKPLDIEEGWDPRVYVKFNNEGNVPESFTGATFELLNQYGGIRLAFIQKSSGFPETAPFTVQEYTVEFPTDFHLSIGQYWGVVNFYQNEKVVASQKTPFQVLKEGSLSSPTEKFLRNVQNYWPYGVGLGVLLVGVYSLGRRRK